ncbi:hypothetical protein [Moritella viscosa]|uniref:Secreted protein n=1 Tax=Moritella viscosa TaxID=80854 RepID=A0A1K9ZQZ5_9GAMM|nr:hypothetical protein [Moritella viscosa]SGZ00802.1 Putative uncharacterized protein [Moritella viscosa]SHO14308.1 Putative uncharacterized protein [Moritella viscosa]SHO14358.1 Putative uncharacterized protein [Moritella viscosa]SHO18281.1 Putative uncharacterized protein [Moritella viscosa]SHO18892.1 Putative uncharacterized protein [Moritella viscosa]
MKKQLKKSIQLLTLCCLFSSTTALAGGTMGGNPGDLSKMKPLLEANWNGKSGIQHTASYGVIVQWEADVCGTLNGLVTDVDKCTKTISVVNSTNQ